MLTTPLRMPKLPTFLERWIADPPPAWVVEFSEEGVFRALTAAPSDVRFEALPAGALHASPVENNLRGFDAVKHGVEGLGLRVAANGAAGREIPVAMLLPDYSVRTSILDFEDFPARREEQEPLIRFRLRKIVPYDLDAARLSFQSFAKQNQEGVTVVASSCPMHVLAEYESLLRQYRCHPGFVSSSALASLSLMPAQGVAMLAKRSGSAMTVAVLQEGILRLMRTVEMSHLEWEEVLSLLQPMFALVEDQLQGHTETLSLCGFRDETAALARALQQEFGVPVAELSSRYGAPQAHNAGALGYVQGLGEVVA